MRIGEWRARGPSREAAAAKVWLTVDPILAGLGAEPDPHGFVAWGDDPAIRFSVYVPTAAGLISCFVRVNIPGEGPRATAKLIRWSRIQIGELSLETQAGHRLLSFQLEQQAIRGVDAQADLAVAFAMELFAAMDGRPAPSRARGRGRAPASKRAAAKPRAPRSAAATTTPQQGSAPTDRRHGDRREAPR